MEKKYTYIGIFALVLYCFPYLTSNIYYFDDIFRNSRAYSDWSNDGRPLADIFYYIFSFGKLLPDVYPLPLFITIAIYYYIYFNLINKLVPHDSYTKPLLIVIMIANPFFISNLSFRYDSSFMVLSLAFAAAPFVLNNRKYSYLLSILFISSSLSLYQTAINVFASVAVIELYVSRDSGAKISNILRKLSHRVIQFFAGYILYSKIILPILPLNTYFKEYSSPLSLSYDGLKGLFLNISDSFVPIKALLNSGMIYPLCFCIVVSVIASTYKSISKKCYIDILIFVLCAASVSFLICGVVLAAKSPAFYSRVYLGFGGFILFFCIVIETCLKSNYIKIPSIGFIVLFMFNFSFISHNAIESKYEYSDKLANNMVEKINDLGLYNTRRVVILGAIKESNLTSLTLKEYPFVAYLTPTTFFNNYDVGRFLLMKNGLNDGFNEITYPDSIDYEKVRKLVDIMKPIYKSYLYSLYYINNMIVIRLS